MVDAICCKSERYSKKSFRIGRLNSPVPFILNQFKKMKNTVLKFALFALLFSVSILNAQTPAPKATTKTVEKEVKIIKTKEAGTTKTTKTTTTTSANPTVKKGAKKSTHKIEKVVIKTDEQVVKVGSEVEAAPAKPEVSSMGGPAPMKGMPIMTFDKKLVDFGQIKMGDTPSTVYNFTNTGDAPLDIEIITGCDCTELDWTRSTVEPGQKGFVSAKYNSNKAEEEDHKKQLEKFVDIILKQTHPSNGYPLVESLKFKVFIVD
jgi:hypothetical protein